MDREPLLMADGELGYAITEEFGLVRMVAVDEYDHLAGEVLDPHGSQSYN